LYAGVGGRNDQGFLAALRMTRHGEMKRLTHVGGDGRAQMVDVSAKPLSARTAIAKGKISLRKETVDLIKKNQIAKGNVIATARLAGIQAAKQTAQLIPLCHTLPLSEVRIDVVTSANAAEVTCMAKTVAQTGVEMEALVGVMIAMLTIYDMCKAVDKEMEMSDLRLVKKTKSAVAAYDRRNQNRQRS
jgi:cyclic pyranopterin monophosphate synthase